MIAADHVPRCDESDSMRLRATATGSPTSTACNTLESSGRGPSAGIGSMAVEARGAHLRGGSH
eukprot:1644987-Prymnesium_polylepis.1